MRIDTVLKHLKIKDRKKIIEVEHEKAINFMHYLQALKNSEKSIVLTNEGIGDKSNLSVSVVRNSKLKIYYSKECKIGSLYKFITLLLGMKPSQHEFKVMGLAPYASEYETNKAYKAAFKIYSKQKVLVFSKKKTEIFHLKINLLIVDLMGLQELQKTVEKH